MKNKPKTIIVALSFAYGSARDILYGIDRYARTHCHWRLRIINNNGDKAIDEIRRADAEGVDGIISSGLEQLALSAYLQKSRTPLVCICAETSNLGRRKTAVAFTNIDDFAIGRAGAKYLASLGRFRAYGFIGREYGRGNYTHLFRERGFRSFFDNETVDVRAYRTAKNVERGSSADIHALAEWLKALPKPAAVMAAHDIRATHVVEAAYKAQIRIPQELVLIGVDNDEIYCETSTPTITSISPDHAQLGELAAKSLKKLMSSSSKATTPTPAIFQTSCTIIERQSSKPIPPTVQLAERITAFIRQNATRGIRASDVAMHIGVSRRLADLRFRQTMGSSILESILSRRFEEATRLLRETDMPIAKIIAASGFKSVSNAKTLFKKRFGIHMSEWRAQHAHASVQYAH